MKHALRDLTYGPLEKQILMFSFPLMVSNVLQVLFNMSDIAVVGRYAGSISLGAVGSTTTTVALFTGFLMGLGGGVNVLVARYFGSHDQKQLAETVHSSALICLIAGLIITFLGLAFSHRLLTLLNTKEELIASADLYLRIYFLGMPALAVYNFGNAVFSAIGNTKRPLFYLALSGVINVLLNLFFVIYCDMDVAGVAIASVISQYISAVLIISALIKSHAAYSLKLSRLRISWDKAKAILTIGIPAGIQNAIFHIANMFIQSGVNSFDATMVSGNSAAANADGLVYTVMSAFYTACSSFMGQNYGAGRKDRVLKSYRISLCYSFGFGAVLGLLLIILAPEFLSIFTKESAVISAGMKRLTIMGFSYAFSAFMDCTIAASRSLGKSLIPTFFVIIGSCVFRVIWIFTVFAYFKTISSLYLLYIFSWIITASAEIIYFRHICRQQLTSVYYYNKKIHRHFKPAF